MASPHVAGVAALLKSVNPSWTAAQLRTAILGNVDQLAAFNGVVATGGRLNAYRTIVPSAITLTSPNGGGIYQRGRNLYINWTSKDVTGQYVSLELLKGGMLNATITSSTYNSGYYTWAIPSGQAVGTDYRVRVSLLSSGVSDQSDSDFEITTTTPTPTRIEIWTLSDLAQMSTNWNDSQHPRNGYYVLMADIDARATTSWNGGLGFKPIGNGDNDWFRGTFDGQGHQITGLFCKRPAEAYAALFAVTMENAVIRNLNLEVKSFYAQGYLNHGGSDYGGVGGIVGENSGLIQNCQVSVNSANAMYVTNGSHCGGIVGENLSRGTILNCGAVGTSSIRARGTSGCNGVGGIAGVNSGLIQWCWVGPDVEIDADYSGSNGDESGGIVGDNEGGRVIECESRAGIVQGQYNVGGIIGLNYIGGEVRDCYWRGGAASGENQVGGAVGENDSGNVTRCYVSGSVSGSGERGSLIGRNSSVIQDSYWNTDVSTLPDVGNDLGTVSNCVGRTATQMMQQASFTNWDFAGVWAINEGVDFPILRGVGLSLTAPTGVTASTGLADGVHVSWVAVPEATHFLVFRSDAAAGPMEALSGKWLSGFAFVDTTATPLTPFYYWVKAGATRDGGRASEFSAPATGSRALPPPQLAASRQGGNIILSWPADAAGFNLVSVTTITSTNWAPVSPPPTVADGQNFVTNTISGNAKFYRLKK